MKRDCATMIHWDTLQESEERCVSDKGGSTMRREDEAVFLYLRPDLANAPGVFDALGALVAACNRVVETWTHGDLAGAVRNLDAARQEAQKLINKVERENDGQEYTSQ